MEAPGWAEVIAGLLLAIGSWFHGRRYTKRRHDERKED